MASQLLFIGYSEDIYTDIRKFLFDHDIGGYFAKSTGEAIQLLDSHNIQTVVIIMNDIKDAAILKFINQYYPDTNVIISASKEFKDIIDLFAANKFSVLKHPFKLNDLAATLF